MDDHSKLLQLVDQLYGSVLDEGALPSTLEALADFAGARSAFYLTADAQTGAILTAHSVNIDPNVQEQYVDHWSERDILLPPALSVPVGQLMTEHSLAPRGEFEESEIYHDLYDHHDIPHLMVAWTRKTPRALTAVSVQRTHAQGRFLKADEQRYTAVVPHLVRALEIRHLLHAARTQTANAMAVINRMPFGVVFLNDSGRVAQASLAAEVLLREGSAIVSRWGSIHATLHDDDNRLQKAIQKTLRAKKDHAVPGDTLKVSRSDGRRSLTIAVVPLRSECVFTPISLGCMLVVFDPDRSPQPAVFAVQQVLRVTEAEAKLVCELFTGITLREAADHLRLSINTCKAQLKSIYSKTGCASHVDLVKATFFAATTNGCKGRHSDSR